MDCNYSNVEDAAGINIGWTATNQASRVIAGIIIGWTATHTSKMKKVFLALCGLYQLTNSCLSAGPNDYYRWCLVDRTKASSYSVDHG